MQIQELGGVEYRRVGRQAKRFDLFSVLRRPRADTVGAMHAQAVDDQEHLALHLPNQILQEDDEAVSINDTL